MELLDYLSKQGPLKDVLPGFSPRPQQTEMAQAVENGLRNGEKVIVEAGTGVGKSLAYLLPSAIWTTKNSKKVVVATYTKALQEQLIRKDLPALRQALQTQGVDLKFSLLMGSENYLCLQRFHRTLEGGSDLFASSVQQDLLEGVGKWADRATTGLRNRIPFEIPHEVWDSINRDSDICLGKKGPYWETCLYRKDVARARSAHILVVNQHLLLAGLPGWLDFDALVVDEAHNLEDVAVSSLGVTLTEQKIKRLLDDTFNIKTARGAILRMRNLPKAVRDDIKTDVKEAHKRSKEFFVAVREKLRLVCGFDVGQGTSAKRVLEPHIIKDQITGLLEGIEISLQRSLAHSDSKEEENQLAALSKRCLETVQQIRLFLRCEDKNFAYWGELRTVRKKPSTVVCVKPIDVSEALRDFIFDKKFPVILTSATLSVRNSFAHFKERIGATNTTDCIVDSPFDYKANARLLIPHNFPDPSTKAAEFDKWVVEFCSRLVGHVPGGIFFLFTSWKTLRSVAASIKTRGIKRTTFIQGEQLPGKLLKSFRDAKNGLLLGTDTFWQGVDVPGPELSCVVITKLPFLPPDTPLEQARQEWYVREGKAPFEHYALPKAVIKFRQGFGRLIRTQKDFGAVIVLDPRIRTKRYGRAFLESVPKCPEIKQLKELSEFFRSKSPDPRDGNDRAIVCLVKAWNAKLPRSSAANILRGAAGADVIKKHGRAALGEHFGRLKGCDYHKIMGRIDAMLGSGELSLQNGCLKILKP